MSVELEKYGDDSSTVDSIKSREIVQEILRFGVNDFQIKKIIKFLALELENRDLMVGVCNLIDGKETVEKSKIEL